MRGIVKGRRALGDANPAARLPLPRGRRPSTMQRPPTDSDVRTAAVFREPDRTPYDLRWRMLGTDVRVHPFFWLFSAVLGWNEFSRPGGGVGYLALWVGCVFVSVLLHEFGHVFMGRLFGADAHIV